MTCLSDFREQIQAAIPALRRYARALTRNAETADDIVQDTLLKLYLADPVRVSENLKAWLYAVCRNRALDVLRKEHRLVLASDDDHSEWLDELQPEPAHDAGKEERTQHGAAPVVRP